VIRGGTVVGGEKSVRRRGWTALLVAVVVEVGVLGAVGIYASVAGGPTFESRRWLAKRKGDLALEVSYYPVDYDVPAKQRPDASEVAMLKSLLPEADVIGG
jgi:hypothetical protein